MIRYKKKYIRFYEELNDFLPDDKKKTRIEHQFIDRTSVKDLIESMGVPHTEIDMVLVNGKSVSFDCIINDKDDISVYPVFETFDITEVQHLRPLPLRDPKFVCDVHLGKLAKNLRMIGIDSDYKNNYTAREIVNISLNERRTILTRDPGLLKRSEVTHGYFVRNSIPLEQTKEIVTRFQLQNNINEFSRCIECNSKLVETEKDKIIHRLPKRISKAHDDFYLCSECNKIYWKGSHFDNMLLKLKLIMED
ncbi:MAG: Mut7-C RNAse domain-containing protein [Ignavibacteriaceae bacterium]